MSMLHGWLALKASHAVLVCLNLVPTGPPSESHLFNLGNVTFIILFREFCVYRERLFYFHAYKCFWSELMKFGVNFKV